MIKQSLLSIQVVWKSAKLITLFKILFCIFAAISPPISIYLTQLLVDTVENHLAISNVMIRLIWITFFLLLSIVFQSSIGYFDTIINIALQRKVNKELAVTVVEKFLSLDYACFENENIADTLKRMGKAPYNNILDVFLNTLKCLSLMVTILGTTIIFTQISIWLTIVFLLIFFPMLYLDYKAVNTMNIVLNSQSEQERKLDYLSSLLMDKHSLLELKIFGAINYILKKWKNINKNVLDERVKTTIKSQKYFAVSTLLLCFWCGIVMSVLILEINNHIISFGMFVSIISSSGTILSSSDSLSRTISFLSKEYLIIDHYCKFLALPEVISNSGTVDVDLSMPHIVFENVRFKYPNSHEEVLKGISFDIPPNKHIALVGENGSGKSTIVKLLCKLYKPDSGKITINGVDINDLSPMDLRKIYSVVFQDFATYSLTLRENISFGNIDQLSNNSLIIESMQQGLSYNILDKLPNHIDTSLGKIDDDGVDLSGGEWQRVAISRAFFSNSPFVILDEPTAALDPIAESEMYLSFFRLLRSKGCLMISHRLASAKMADMIYVIKDGFVSEMGSHDELIGINGIYKSMFESQSSWYNITPKEGTAN